SSIFVIILPRSPRSTLFPYTTLFRSSTALLPFWEHDRTIEWSDWSSIRGLRGKIEYYLKGKEHPFLPIDWILLIENTSDELLNKDRKSTRLNSSHVKISYAVFCLKKK